MVDQVLLAKIRTDSLSKHEGMTRKYGSLPLDSCKQIIVNRKANGNEVQVVFEECDGYGHGLNVPPEWILEDHIASDRMPCPRCAGAGKLTLHGIDCSECSGTGMIPKDRVN